MLQSLRDGYQYVKLTFYCSTHLSKMKANFVKGTEQEETLQGTALNES